MADTKDSAEKKIAMMRAAYKAWPDTEGYLSEYQDDAVWHSPMAGDLRGKQAIRGLLEPAYLHQPRNGHSTSTTSWSARSTPSSCDATTCGSQMAASSTACPDPWHAPAYTSPVQLSLRVGNSAIPGL